MPSIRTLLAIAAFTLASGILSCGGRVEGAGPAVGVGAGAPVAAKAPTEHGPPLDFILDPVGRDGDWSGASALLRGKRAIVIVVTTYDGVSLVQLREAAPMLRELPADTTCLLVALQPLHDRTIISAYFDAVETPCIKAIGDITRGRLGDLAQVNEVPATIVLRADGTAVGAAPGFVKAQALAEELERAK